MCVKDGFNREVEIWSVFAGRISCCRGMRAAGNRILCLKCLALNSERSPAIHFELEQTRSGQYLPSRPVHSFLPNPSQKGEIWTVYLESTLLCVETKTVQRGGLWAKFGS